MVHPIRDIQRYAERHVLGVRDQIDAESISKSKVKEGYHSANRIQAVSRHFSENESGNESSIKSPPNRPL